MLPFLSQCNGRVFKSSTVLTYVKIWLPIWHIWSPGPINLQFSSIGALSASSVFSFIAFSFHKLPTDFFLSSALKRYWPILPQKLLPAVLPDWAGSRVPAQLALFTLPHSHSFQIELVFLVTTAAVLNNNEFENQSNIYIFLYILGKCLNCLYCTLQSASISHLTVWSARVITDRSLFNSKWWQL